MAAEGTFILADIGGYTSFLSGVGIEHGKETIEHLLNRLIKSSDKRWKVGNIMGDCVFFYADAPGPPQDTFGRVRALYESFHDARLDVASGSTCRCGACDRTEELTLKFVVHAGPYDVQNIGGRKELIGTDIVLATRLLKNSVPVDEYVIVTDRTRDLIEASGIDGSPVTDELDGIGSVEYHYIDLGPVRVDYERKREFYLTDEDARIALSAEIEAPIDDVWSAMRDLKKRAVWQVTIDSMMHIQGGENRVGEVHSCLHGKTQIVHATVAIDDANRRKTERVWISPPIMKDTYITLFAEPLAGGRTRAGLRATFRPRAPVLSHLAAPVFIWQMSRMIRKDLAGLKEFCETGRVAAREAAAAESRST